MRCYETGTYLATIEIVPCKVIKDLVTVVCFPFGCDCIFKKGVPDPLSDVNTQRTIPKRKVDLARVVMVRRRGEGAELEFMIVSRPR